MTGRNDIGGAVVESPKEVSTLADPGIHDKTLSARAQKLAAIPIVF
jgi:hypothetical protein